MLPHQIVARRYQISITIHVATHPLFDRPVIIERRMCLYRASKTHRTQDSQIISHYHIYRTSHMSPESISGSYVQDLHDPGRYTFYMRAPFVDLTQQGERIPRWMLPELHVGI
jgi:hypothetical protein